MPPPQTEKKAAAVRTRSTILPFLVFALLAIAAGGLLGFVNQGTDVDADNQEPGSTPELVTAARLALAEERVAAVAGAPVMVDELRIETDRTLTALRTRLSVKQGGAASLADVIAEVEQARETLNVVSYTEAARQLDELSTTTDGTNSRTPFRILSTILIATGIGGVVVATVQMNRSITSTVTESVTTSVTRSVTKSVAGAAAKPIEELAEAVRPLADTEIAPLIERVRHGHIIDEPPAIEPLAAGRTGPAGELAAAIDDLRTATHDLAQVRRGTDHLLADLGDRNRELAATALSRLTSLERHEEDPIRLGRLFDVDSAVTQMRRHSETITAIAGCRSARMLDSPLAMETIVRGALSEISGFEQVDIVSLDPGRIDGSAATDLIHLLAELLDEATTAIAPDGRVQIGSHTGQDSSYALTIDGATPSLEPQTINAINEQLSDPPLPTELSAQLLGQYVVGRLADRHGVTVTLTDATEDGTETEQAEGTRITITVPATILVASDAPDATGGDPLLPVRDRGQALAETRLGRDRRAREHGQRSTDNSAASADSFSSMMSSLSAGLNRAERRGTNEAAAGARRRSSDRPSKSRDRLNSSTGRKDTSADDGTPKAQTDDDTAARPVKQKSGNGES